MKGLLFTYVLTYGGAVASLFSPFVGLLIYICFAVVRPESLWHWSIPPGNYSRIIAIALLIGWSLHGFGNWNFGRAKPVVFALCAFWGWSIVSACFAPNHAVAWDFVEAQSKIFLPFIVGMTLVDSVEKLKQVAWVLLLSLGYVALDLNQSYLNGFNRMHLQGFGGMDNNGIAIAMVAGAGLAFFLGIWETNGWRRWLAFAAAALMAHCVMFSLSRGGMLALLITGGVSFLLIPKQPKHYVYFILAVALALRMAGPAVVYRFQTIFADAEVRDESAQSRLDLWANCWMVMLDHPVLGVGPDHWPLIAAQYGWPAGKDGHTLWLQIGAELGFVGVALLIAFYGLCVSGVWYLLRTDHDPSSWFAGSARMVIASLAGFAVSACFVSLEGLEFPYYVVLLGAGAMKLSDQTVVSPESEASVPSPPDICTPYIADLEQYGFTEAKDFSRS
jgi:putative inorganic carbon (hco3(-)) transporter